MANSSNTCPLRVAPQRKAKRVDIDAFSLAVLASILAAFLAPPPLLAASARVSIAIPGSPMHGIEGITVGPDGALYVASLAGKALYRVEPLSGKISTFVGPPDGAADDLTFARDGTVVWTGGAHLNALMARSPRGGLRTLVRDTPGLNAVRFTADGRLFFTRIFMGDGLYEADPEGAQSVRAVAEGIGGLNAFDFSADGGIVGPLFMRGTLVRIDPDTGATRQIADGFFAPSAARVLPDGYLVLNYRLGEIWRLNADATTRRLIAKVEPPADNFILKDGGTLYVTSTAYNGITEVNLASGATRRVTWSGLTLPGMLAVTREGGAERLLIADDSAVKRFDPKRGSLEILNVGSAGIGVRGVAPIRDGYAVSNAYQPSSLSIVDAGSGTRRGTISGFGRTMALATDGSMLLVADYGRGEIVRVDPARVDSEAAGADSRQILARGLQGPVGLAVGASGSIYVSEYDAGRITQLDPGPTRDSPYRSRTILDGLRHPEGLALAADGRLLVVDTGQRTLFAVDLAAGTRTILAEHLAVGFTNGDSGAGPVVMTGLAVMEDGTAYLSGNVDNVLYRISFPRPASRSRRLAPR
jgi:sugar lactone lactonase YvrE